LWNCSDLIFPSFRIFSLHGMDASRAILFYFALFFNSLFLILQFLFCLFLFQFLSKLHFAFFASEWRLLTVVCYAKLLHLWSSKVIVRTKNKKSFLSTLFWDASCVARQILLLIKARKLLKKRVYKHNFFWFIYLTHLLHMKCDIEYKCRCD